MFIVVVLSRGAIQPPPLSAMFLAPQGITSYVLGVEWTLPFEMTFYIMLFAAIAARAQFLLPWLGLGWVLLILAGVLIWPDLQQGQFPLLLNLPMSTFCLPFAGGLIIPTAIRRGWIGPATPILGLCAIAANEAIPNAILGFALMTLGCVLLVAAAARPPDTVNAAPPNLALSALGDWSYALFLIHVPVIRALDSILPATTPYLAQWCATVAAPIAVSVVFGKVDLWIYRTLKRRVDRAGSRTLKGLTVSFLAIMLVLAVAAHWRAIEAQRATEKLGPVANLILAALDARTLDLSAAAERAGLARDPSLVGYLDNTAVLPPQKQFLQGWAGDTSFSARPVDVLIFQCGVYLGAAVVGEDRPDVAASLRVSHRSFGFSATVPSRVCPQDNLTALVVTKDQHYGLISAPAPHK